MRCYECRLFACVPSFSSIFLDDGSVATTVSGTGLQGLASGSFELNGDRGWEIVRAGHLSPLSSSLPMTCA